MADFLAEMFPAATVNSIDIGLPEAKKPGRPRRHTSDRERKAAYRKLAGVVIKIINSKRPNVWSPPPSAIGSQAQDESLENVLDRPNVASVLEPSVNVAPEVGGHLCAFLPNHENASFSLHADKESRLENHIVARDREFRALRPAEEPTLLLLLRRFRIGVVTREQEDTATAQVRGLRDFFENCSCDREVTLPIQDRRGELRFDVVPYLCCSGGRAAAVPEKYVSAISYIGEPDLERMLEITRREPVLINIGWKLTHVLSEVVLKYPSWLNVVLHEYQERDRGDLEHRSFVLGILARHPNICSRFIKMAPSRHADDHAADTAPNNVLGVGPRPGFASCDSLDAARVIKNLRLEAELLDVLDHCPLEFILPFGQQCVGH